MSNVIALNVPGRRPTPRDTASALIACFSGARRFGDDVFWLKENAELLNILECTGADLAPDALAPLEGFYKQVEKRLAFFPQYYRFLLSICLDLEDLGLPGSKGAALAGWVATQGLVEAELSDLQRAEAARLLNRRNVAPRLTDDGLDDRLRGFIARSNTFALPNKKAAYELTHIVFYLSEYGRRDPRLCDGAITSLEFAGLLAYLDQNADLLAEVCVALRFAGRTPSDIWEGWLERHVHRFELRDCGDSTDRVQDDYHEFLVGSWALASAGRDYFNKQVAPGRTEFFKPAPFAGPLRNMSECMFRLDEQRSCDWARMQPHVVGALGEIEQDILAEAIGSTDKFEAFFEGFSRAGLRGGPV